MLTEFEMININPEIDSKRALEYKKIMDLPDNAVVVFFHQIKDLTEKTKGGKTNTKTVRVEENYGHYYIKNRKAHVGGYIPCMLGYTSMESESSCRVIWPDIDNTRLAHQRFLLFIMEYKKKYGFRKLQKMVRRMR